MPSSSQFRKRHWNIGRDSQIVDLTSTRRCASIIDVGLIDNLTKWLGNIIVAKSQAFLLILIYYSS